MANNRLTLRCSHCGAVRGLLKYYPATGWYVNSPVNAQWVHELDAWLDAHRHHADMFGDDVIVEREVEVEEV